MQESCRTTQGWAWLSPQVVLDIKGFQHIPMAVMIDGNTFKQRS